MSSRIITYAKIGRQRINLSNSHQIKKCLPAIQRVTSPYKLLSWQTKKLVYSAIIGIFWNTGQTGETVISNNYFKSIYGIYTNSETKNKLNLSNVYKYEVLGSMNAKLRKRNYSKRKSNKTLEFWKLGSKGVGNSFCQG